MLSPHWPVRPGKWVDSPRKVSRFAPLNCYYIIIDEIYPHAINVLLYRMKQRKHIYVKYCWQTYSKSIGTLFQIFQNHIVTVACKWCVSRLAVILVHTTGSTWYTFLVPPHCVCNGYLLKTRQMLFFKLMNNGLIMFPYIDTHNIYYYTS
jgi:hypothetical protein